MEIRCKFWVLQEWVYCISLRVFFYWFLSIDGLRILIVVTRSDSASLVTVFHSLLLTGVHSFKPQSCCRQLTTPKCENSQTIPCPITSLWDLMLIWILLHKTLIWKVQELFYGQYLPTFISLNVIVAFPMTWE